MKAARLIRAIEVWVPRGHVLVQSSGAYGDHAELARVSASATFRRGEGLPGAAWSTERPLVWQELGSHFVRADQALAAGVDTALAMPVFSGSALTAVIVLLMSTSCESPGCVEIWGADTDLNVLTHAGGHYSGCAEFDRFSRLIQFPFGTGLPGGTFAAGKPVVMHDVRRATTFIRSGLAASCGLKFGVGIPFRRGRSAAYVVTLLASEKRPFLQAIEHWEAEPGADGARLALRASSEAVAEPATREAPGEGLAAGVLATGVPKVVAVKALEDAPIADDGAPTLALGIPVTDGEHVRGVTCLVF
jgi:hypothetical protein